MAWNNTPSNIPDNIQDLLWNELESNDSGLLVLWKKLTDKTTLCTLALSASCMAIVNNASAETKTLNEELVSDNIVSEMAPSRDNIDTSVIVAPTPKSEVIEWTYWALHQRAALGLYSKETWEEIKLTGNYIDHSKTEDPLKFNIGEFQEQLVDINSTPLSEKPLNGDTVVNVLLDYIKSNNKKDLDTSRTMEEIAKEWEERLSTFSNIQLDELAIVLKRFNQNLNKENLTTRVLFFSELAVASAWSNHEIQEMKEAWLQLPETALQGNPLAAIWDIYKILLATSEDPEEVRKSFIKIFPTQEYADLTWSSVDSGYIVAKELNFELLQQVKNVLWEDFEFANYNFEGYGELLTSYNQLFNYIPQAFERNFDWSDEMLELLFLAEEEMPTIKEMPLLYQAYIAKLFKWIESNKDYTQTEKDSLVAKLIISHSALVKSVNELAWWDNFKVSKEDVLESYKFFNDDQILSLLTSNNLLKDNLSEFTWSILSSAFQNDAFSEDEANLNSKLINGFSEALYFSLKNT